MNIFKKLSAVAIMVVVIFCMNHISFAESISNPVTATSTVAKDGTFSVNINVKAQTDMQAFTYVLRYDATKITVVGKRVTGYGFYSDFYSAYNSNNRGVLAYNNVVNGTDSRLIFAGAQVNADLAKVQEDSKVAYIKFQMVNDVADQEAFEEILAGIKLQVEYLEGSMGNMVTIYPEAFSESVAVQLVQDETGGEDIVLGDLNMDQSISLEDAQIALKAALNITTLTMKESLAADVNGDDTVDLADANIILKAALNIITI